MALKGLYNNLKLNKERGQPVTAVVSWKHHKSPMKFPGRKNINLLNLLFNKLVSSLRHCHRGLEMVVLRSR